MSPHSTLRPHSRNGAAIVRHAWVALLAAWLALPLHAHANDSVEALRAADDSWNTMRLQPDVEGLDALLADDWVLTHSDGRVQHKADYLRDLASRNRANQAIANEDVAVRRHGALAVVTGTSLQAGVSNGQPWSGKFRFTRTWIEHEGRWRMLASHSSRISVQE